MSKKIATYEDLLAEKQKLEMLFQAQRALVNYEMQDIKAEVKPAFNAIEFLKKLAVRNSENPVLQTGVNLLIDTLSNKLQGDNHNLLRSTVIPNILKNYASNLLAVHADELIEYLLSLFHKENESVEED